LGLAPKREAREPNGPAKRGLGPVVLSVDPAERTARVRQGVRTCPLRL